jgi:AcrR family transcriptional regulator
VEDVVDKPGRKRTRKTKTERRREIVEATVQLIAQYGLQGVTISRISAAVGLTKSGLYQHFRSRDEVLIAALDALGRLSSAWISQPADAVAGPVELARAHAAWSLSHYESFIRPFFEFVASAGAINLKAQVTERVEGDWRTLVDRVAEAQQQGAISRDASAEDVAWSIMMLLWAEDLSQLMGVDRHFLGEGASARIRERLLGTFLPAGAAPAGPATSRTS